MCLLFTSQIYQPKIKCKNGDSYLYKNEKYIRWKKKKKKSVISFQKFLIFHVWVFQKMLKVSSKHSFKCSSHCVKSVKIRSFSGPYRPNWSGLSGLRISPYSVRMRENTEHKKIRICTHFTQCQKEHTISPQKAYKLEKPGVLRMMTI